MTTCDDMNTHAQKRSAGCDQLSLPRSTKSHTNEMTPCQIHNAGSMRISLA